MIALFISGQAHADRGQWLFGMGVDPLLPGTTTVNIDTENSGYMVDKDRTAGYKFYLGYDLSSNITIEAGHTYLGEVAFTNEGVLSYKASSLSISYYIPENSLGPAFFLKAGSAKLDVTGNVPFAVRSTTQYFMGVGVDIQFDNGFSLRGEYEYFDDDAQVLNMSISKRFGEIRRAPVKLKKPDSPAPEKYMGPGIYIIEGGFSKLDEQALGIQVRNKSDKQNKTGKPKPDAETKQEKDDLPAVETMPARESDTAVQNQVLMEKHLQLSEMLGVIDGVQFIPGTTEFSGATTTILDKLARSIMYYSDYAFLIIGHTDDAGNSQANEELSLARAKAVGEYFISKGVSSGILDYFGAGDEEPLVPNATSGGRAINRRVELELQ